MPGDRSAADLADLDALRIDALTWLSPSISHELANPLAALVAFSGLLAGDPRLPPEVQADVRMLGDEADRTYRLVRTLLELLRDRPAVSAPVDVAVLLDEVLALAAPRMTDIDVVRQIDEPPPVADSDPSGLRRVILVLVVEAVRALGARPRGARMALEARRLAPDRVAVALEYRHAPGAPDAQVRDARLPAGERAIPTIGGMLRVTRDDIGGRFEVELPAAAVAMADADTNRHAPRGPAQLTVLVCDDEDAIRTLLVRVLERDGLRAVAAPDGPAALVAIGSEPVDVVLTDHRMAGMSGVELYERAIELRPSLRTRFVVTSGEPGSDELREFAERTGVRVLPKPFDIPAIPALVREIAREDTPDGAPEPQRG
jgi:two-component system NtrC family sensor kinase